VPVDLQESPVGVQLWHTSANHGGMNYRFPTLLRGLPWGLRTAASGLFAHRLLGAEICCLRDLDLMSVQSIADKPTERSVDRGQGMNGLTLAAQVAGVAWTKVGPGAR
jgi:hypothetical protein